MKYRLNQKLEVEWVDIIQDPSWLDEKKAGERPTESDCLTVGYFTKDDGEFMYLSSTVRGNQRDQIAIPLGVIKGVRKLKC